jgi:hypothetical protein
MIKNLKTSFRKPLVVFVTHIAVRKVGDGSKFPPMRFDGPMHAQCSKTSSPVTFSGPESNRMVRSRNSCFENSAYQSQQSVSPRIPHETEKMMKISSV